MSRISKGAGLVLLVVLVFALPAILGGNDYWLSVIIIAAINILMISSLRLILLLDLGSLGHVGFALVGAYGSALMMMKLHLPFWVSLPAAGLMAAMIALLLSYPFLKVKGVYFVLLTLLTAETFRLVVWYWMSLTGGAFGLVEIPAPGSMRLPFVGTIDFRSVDTYYYIVAIVVLICMTFMYLFEHSHLSFKWRAIRDGDEISRSVGINVMRYRMISFVVACFFAGIAGGLFAHYQHNISADVPSRFGIMMSIYLLVYLIIGGKKHFVGPIIGTIVMTLVTEFTRPVKEYQPMITGAIAILVMLAMPGGLAELPLRLRTWRDSWRERKLGKTWDKSKADINSTSV